MKKYIFLFISIFVCFSCTVFKPLTPSNPAADEVKPFLLEQSPSVQLSGNSNEWPGKPLKKIPMVYIFEEKPPARPEITLTLQLDQSTQKAKTDSMLFIELENELIQLFPVDSLQMISTQPSAASTGEVANRKYFIPENLWVSILHSRETGYRLKMGEAELEIKLNQAEKEKLAEFLQLCIGQRDKKFPTVPQGQVKW